jgi:hypothetical protein
MTAAVKLEHCTPPQKAEEAAAPAAAAAVPCFSSLALSHEELKEPLLDLLDKARASDARGMHGAPQRRLRASSGAACVACGGLESLNFGRGTDTDENARAHSCSWRMPQRRAWALRTRALPACTGGRSRRTVCAA